MKDPTGEEEIQELINKKETSFSRGKTQRIMEDVDVRQRLLR